MILPGTRVLEQLGDGEWDIKPFHVLAVVALVWGIVSWVRKRRL